MNDFNVKVNLQDVDQVKDIIVSAAQLIKQIDINKYHGSLNHNIRMNESYHKLKKALANLQPIR